MLNADHISFRAGDRFLVKEVSSAFEPGLFHVIMGANGAGKSTLLQLLAGDLLPSGGKIIFDGNPLGSFSKKELARRRAVLSQHYHIQFPITVDEIILMGRYPFFSNHPSLEDRKMCEHAKQLMQIEDLSARDYTTLSGGEGQKVQMARVLAQIGNGQEGEGKILFLDEPVSHLDVRYQYQLLRVAKDLCQRGTTVIAILHDLNLALTFADRILFLKQGCLVHDLKQVGSISTRIVRDVFDIDCRIVYPEGDQPLILF